MVIIIKDIVELMAYCKSTEYYTNSNIMIILIYFQTNQLSRILQQEMLKTVL